MSYIPRAIESLVEQTASEYAVLLVTGPRQVGNRPCSPKKTASPSRSMTKGFGVLDRASVPRGTGAIICAAEKVSALDGDTLVIPAGLL